MKKNKKIISITLGVFLFSNILTSQIFAVSTIGAVQVQTIADGDYIGPLWFQQANDRLINLFGTGGNIGIGIENPTEKLEVDGRLSINGTPNSGDDVGNRDYNDNRYIQAGTGGISTVTNIISEAPTQSGHLATKAYVDSVVASSGGGQSAVSSFSKDGIYYSVGGESSGNYFCKKITIADKRTDANISENTHCAPGKFCSNGECLPATIHAIGLPMRLGKRVSTGGASKLCEEENGGVPYWGYTRNPRRSDPTWAYYSTYGGSYRGTSSSSLNSVLSASEWHAIVEDGEWALRRNGTYNPYRQKINSQYCLVFD